jgi:hypothetical protein
MPGKYEGRYGSGRRAEVRKMRHRSVSRMWYPMEGTATRRTRQSGRTMESSPVGFRVTEVETSVAALQAPLV